MTASELDECRSVVERQDEAERAASCGHTARAALVCHRITPTGPITSESTIWDTIEQARQASAELSPCSALCSRIHSVVRVDLVEVGR
jgi:hypothetical protein